MVVGLGEVIWDGGSLVLDMSCSKEARNGLVEGDLAEGFTGVPFAERGTCGEGRAGEGKAEEDLGTRKGLLELRDRPGEFGCSVAEVRGLDGRAYQSGRGSDARRLD